MTTEQKAKAYDEAIERMKSWVRGEHPECFTEAQKAAEFIFPELAESEDEKIRKRLIDFFEDWHENRSHCWGIAVTNIIAWLEKQSHDGKKWIYEDEYYKEKEQLYQDGVDDVLENPHKYGLEKQGETFTKKDVDNAYLKGICDAKHELEKQGQVKESDIPQQEEKTCKENDNSLTSEQRVEEAMRELEEKSKVYMEAHKETADDFIALCRGEQKPAWSEEDEKMLNDAIVAAYAAAYYTYNDRQKIENWLKSIKQRIGG